MVPKRYPWEKSKEKPLTIGLGIMCSDGIVLAVNNEYSQDPIKFEGQKLFPLKQGKNYTILAAASNNVGTAKKGIEIIEEHLSVFAERMATTEELKSWLEASLKKLTVEYVDFAPTKKERDALHCDFLFAIWVRGEGTRLFYSHRNNILEERQQKSIGTGLYFSTFVSNLLFGHLTTVRPTVRRSEVYRRLYSSRSFGFFSQPMHFAGE